MYSLISKNPFLFFISHPSQKIISKIKQDFVNQYPCSSEQTIAYISKDQVFYYEDTHS